MTAAVRPLQVTVQALLRATADSDHLVRGQAAASIGCLLPTHWSSLSEQAVADVIAVCAHLQAALTEKKNVAPSTQFASLWKGYSLQDINRRTAREAMLERLLICAQDKVGTACFVAILLSPYQCMYLFDKEPSEERPSRLLVTWCPTGAYK